MDAENARQRERREHEQREASTHPATRDSADEAIVVFNPLPVTLEGQLYIFSPRLDGFNPREVGYVIVAPRGPNVIELQKLMIYCADRGRGYARSALRDLIAHYRVSGVHALCGRVSPYHCEETKEGRQSEHERLRLFYKKVGFILDHQGVVDELWLDLLP